MDCQICCESFNLSSRKEVDCSFCDLKVCRSCVQQYLLTTVNDPHCMKCKSAWNREFVDQSCTKTFRNKNLKEHRENVLLEREKSYLPETQPYAAREKQRRQLVKLVYDAQNEIDNQRHLIRTLQNNIDVLARGHNLEEGSETKKVFIRKCPVEDCKGFLSSRWKCEMCENTICSQCNEIKEETGHECDEKNVETANLLKKDTKPCPTCGTLIFKSSGCNQMWCTACHGSFNWATGRVETGIVHNPHFYEYQRRIAGSGQANRNVGDIPCGGLPTIEDLNIFFNKIPRDPVRRTHRWIAQRIPDTEKLSETENTVYNVHRLISHLEHYEFRYNLREEWLVTNNRDLRVKFLLNEISENELKTMIQKREKGIEKKRDLIQILRMFSITASDMLRQLVLTQLNIDPFISNINQLKNYTNDELKILTKRYTCKVYIIDKQWNYI
jgi:hypothetical protein